MMLPILLLLVFGQILMVSYLFTKLNKLQATVDCNQRDLASITKSESLEVKNKIAAMEILVQSMKPQPKPISFAKPALTDAKKVIGEKVAYQRTDEQKRIAAEKKKQWWAEKRAKEQQAPAPETTTPQPLSPAETA